MTEQATARILLITGEEALGTVLAEQIALLDGVVLVRADGVPPDGEDREDGTVRGRWAAILLDLDLPGAGPAPWSGLRNNGALGPILALTSRPGEPVGIDGVEPVAKPVRLGALMARLRDLVRRAASTAAEAEALPLGPYVFRPADKLLLAPGGTGHIRLTEKEARILAFLYRAGAQAVPRETLLGEVWGYSAGVTTHTVETHIYRLRRKIAQDAGAADLLVTEAGGYRLAL